jgi:hypothetical protein
MCTAISSLFPTLESLSTSAGTSPVLEKSGGQCAPHPFPGYGSHETRPRDSSLLLFTDPLTFLFISSAHSASAVPFPFYIWATSRIRWDELSHSRGQFLCASDEPSKSRLNPPASCFWFSVFKKQPVVWFSVSGNNQYFGFWGVPGCGSCLEHLL